MNAPFIIYALPRSRTAWLSRFLSFGGWTCGHDELRHVRSMEDVESWFSQPCTGTVETAAAPWWRLVQSCRSDIRTVVVRRPVADVVESLMALNLGFDPDVLRQGMTRLDHKLDQIEARVPGVLSVRFDDLVNEQTCAAVFERCLSYTHNHDWWWMMDALNVQISMLSMIRYHQAYQRQMARVADIARHQVIADMARRPATDLDGITIQQEGFDTFFADAQRLFPDHCMRVGETPGQYFEKNWAAMRQQSESGTLQITTARSNGRIFGYLMAHISPSLERTGELWAVHGLFYGSSDVPGIGIRLQRASIAALRDRGVGEVHLAGRNRGSGPKMPALYRRFGAEEMGAWYRLDLRDAA